MVKETSTKKGVPILIYISIFVALTAVISALFAALAYDLRAKRLYELETRHHLEFLAARVASMLVNPMTLDDIQVVENIMNNNVANDFMVDNAIIVRNDGTVIFDMSGRREGQKIDVEDLNKGSVTASSPIVLKTGQGYGAIISHEQFGELHLFSEKRYMFESERIGTITSFAAGLSKSVADAAVVGDYLGAREVIENMARSDENIIYIQLLQTDGTIIFHSEIGMDEEQARALEGGILCDDICERALKVSPRHPMLIQEYDGAEGVPALDISTPVLRRGEKIAVLRTAYSLGGVIAEHRRTKLLIAATTSIFLLVGGLLSVLMAAKISRPIRHIAGVARSVGEGDLNQTVAVLSGGRETRQLGEAFNQMIAGLREREFIKDTFSRYVTSQVADQLLKNPEQVSLGGVNREVTILFSDIRGFTTFSEKLAPEEVVSQLNEYLSEMVDVIFKYEGTLDKFIGDAIMAVFGAPILRKNDPLRAVKTALEMQQRLVGLNEKRTAQGKDSLKIGIGINTGEVIAGNIGDVRRMEYTVIGDNVNLASRIEGLTKNYDCPIIISESTYIKVKDVVIAKKLESTTVKGKTRMVDIYELSGMKDQY